MSLTSEVNKALATKEIKRTKHLFPLKDSTFRNKDLIEGIKVILSKDVTMSKVTKKFEKTFSKKMGVLEKLVDIYNRELGYENKSNLNS